MASNLCSVIVNEHIVRINIAKECDEGRVLSSFRAHLIPNLQVSSLRVVLKKAAGEFWLIHHLSFPHGGSVNDAILDHHGQVHFI